MKEPSAAKEVSFIPSLSCGPRSTSPSQHIWRTGKLEIITEDFKELLVASDVSKLVVRPGVPLQTRSEVSPNPWSGQKNGGLERQPEQVVKHEVFSQAHAYRFSARGTRFGPHVPSVSLPSVEKSLGLTQARAVRLFGWPRHFTQLVIHSWCH